MHLSPAVRGWLSFVRRWTWRITQPVLVLLLAFGGAVLIGLVPVNRDFENADEGIEVFVYVDNAHSKIVVPVRTEVRDWRPLFSTSDFAGLVGDENYIAFGWGDREFFLHTRQWEDLQPDLTAWAMLWPTNTVMHVTMKTRPQSSYYRMVTITPEAYAKMVEFIDASFVFDGSPQLGGVRPRLIPGCGYNHDDAFYEANGTYSLLYTCNAWAGDALEVAGVRTGCWTPFPVGVLQVEE